jgi:hypothetical protein
MKSRSVCLVIKIQKTRRSSEFVISGSFRMLELHKLVHRMKIHSCFRRMNRSCFRKLELLVGKPGEKQPEKPSCKPGPERPWSAAGRS